VKRWQIINYLIKKYNYKSYVEIGLHNGDCFRRVGIENKISVDPAAKYKADFIMTSDVFFKEISPSVKYDIFLIDGLHHSDQVYLDINNALDHLNDNGVIVCHDMNPTSADIQKVPRETKEWTGDCWKAFVWLRTERNDLDMFVVDTDYGCGVIRKSSKRHTLLDISEDEITYKNLNSNRKKWLNLVSVEEFKDKA